MDYGSYPQHWLLFDRLVQQIVLQTSQANLNADAIVSEDNDPIAPLSNLNVKEIVHQLGQESEISELRVRTEELEKENIELATNLSQKEQVKICHYIVLNFKLLLIYLTSIWYVVTY